MDRLTNIGFNTQAQVQDLIRQREQIHWFLGLREAEEFMRTCSAALEETRFNLRRQDRVMRRYKIELEAIKDATEPLKVIQKEDLEDRLARAQRSLEQLKPMLRDTAMELATAAAECNRILQLHPEATQLSYEELQERYTPEALLEKQAYFLAGRVMAATRGLPESVGDLLVSLKPEARDQIASRALELQHGVSNQLMMQEIAQTLAMLPPEECQKILQQSIALIQQRKQLEAAFDTPRA